MALTHQATELLRLWWGTVLLRPYVYAFLLVFAWRARRHMGARDSLLFACCAYLTAYLAEYSATRNGFPFGLYRYLDASRDRELWLGNIPFWDPLSFVFLAYFSWILAVCLRPWRQGQGQVLWQPVTWCLGAAIMTLLDVVIDPATLRGGEWFLGALYVYPTPGPYFGVTLQNFLGWFVVALAIMAQSALMARWGWLRPGRWRPLTRVDGVVSLGVAGGVLAMMLAVTVSLGAWSLVACDLAWTALLLCGASWRLAAR